MKDIIRLAGMTFYAYHGVSAAEKETGRIFEVDCELEVDLAEAGHTDKLADTIDYGRVYAAVKELAEGKAYALIEKLAENLADKLLDKFPVYRVTLKVRKLNPPVAGQIKFIEIEITRFQGDTDKLIKSTDR
ncbi:MAG: dihydroneopterin aldolase [candidate division Zixibacteria bacterium]|nr:dihydroneopterin aldolase [candidate division Zixibacteria bacterium]